MICLGQNRFYSSQTKTALDLINFNEAGFLPFLKFSSNVQIYTCDTSITTRSCLIFSTASLSFVREKRFLDFKRTRELTYVNKLQAEVTKTHGLTRINLQNQINCMKPCIKSPRQGVGKILQQRPSFFPKLYVQTKKKGIHLCRCHNFCWIEDEDKKKRLLPLWKHKCHWSIYVRT